jgi:hypothetical protein
VKYFFLTDGWTVGRVWASDGLWNETAWRRRPDIQRINLCLVQASEKLWLYQVEEVVLTVEVIPIPDQSEVARTAIGQVVLKRLLSAEQIIDRLNVAEAMCQLTNIQSVVQ